MQIFLLFWSLFISGEFHFKTAGKRLVSTGKRFLHTALLHPVAAAGGTIAVNCHCHGIIDLEFFNLSKRYQPFNTPGIFIPAAFAVCREFFPRFQLILFIADKCLIESSGIGTQLDMGVFPPRYRRSRSRVCFLRWRRRKIYPYTFPDRQISISAHCPYWQA